MGLSVQALTSKEIWSVVWKQFNRSNVPKIPNLLKLETGKTENQKGDLPTRYHLLENEKSVPVADRSWVKLHEKYIGVFFFKGEHKTKLRNVSQMRFIQLRRLWELIILTELSDVEIFFQVSELEVHKTNYPGNTAAVLCIYKDNLHQLDEFCQNLASSFLSDIDIYRDKSCAWKTWLHCTSVVWAKLLTLPESS